ncbi:hypothetical protein KC351_g11958 [Hortaea werneckii]|nr:hypothetical protein KC351_g11958 [Hortaea werneckii]
MPSKRKRQTQLTFSPLPSSSPASQGYNRQIQDRAAAVGYKGSPAKKRRRLQENDNEGNGLTALPVDGVNEELPTPAATMRENTESSSGDEDGIEDHENDLARSRRETNGSIKLPSRNKSARQWRLDFSNARDPESFDPATTLPSSSLTDPSSSAKAGMFGSSQKRFRKGKHQVEDSDSDNEPSGSHEQTAKPKKNSKKRSSKVSEVEPGQDDVQSRNTRRSKRQANATSAPDAVSEDDEDDVPVRPVRSSQRTVVVSDDEDGEDDVPVRPLRSSQRTVIPDEEDDDDVIAVSRPMEQLDTGDDSGEDLPTTAGKKSRGKRRQRNDNKSLSGFVVDRPSENESDEESGNQPSSGRKRRRQPRQERQESEAESEDEQQPVTPRKRLLSRQEQADLDEDLDFLGPSSDQEALNRTPQTTQAKQKAARLSALEQLKRKRTKQPELVPLDEEDEEEESAEEPLGYPDDGEDDGSSEVEEIGHRLPTSTSAMFQADEDDENFVEEGEEGDDPTAIPEGMPIEFTPYARKKAKDLFKFAVEWMVQKKLNPAFDMQNEIYDLTFRKLDDEVKGLAGSKFTSSAWTPNFTMAVRSRPEIAFEEYEESEGAAGWRNDGKCDACNRGGHPATWQVQFQGKPYHPATLEDVSPRHDSDDEDSGSDDAASSNDADSDDGDQPGYDHTGRQIPPANTIYYVGKFCMANARTAHTLNHWRWHLYQWAVMWLTKTGYMTDEKVVKRDGWSSTKRRKYANKVVDRMEADGVVGDLWKEFRRNLDEARTTSKLAAAQGGAVAVANYSQQHQQAGPGAPPPGGQQAGGYPGKPSYQAYPGGAAMAASGASAPYPSALQPGYPPQQGHQSPAPGYSRPPPPPPSQSPYAQAGAPYQQSPYSQPPTPYGQPPRPQTQSPYPGQQPPYGQGPPSGYGYGGPPPGPPPQQGGYGQPPPGQYGAPPPGPPPGQQYGGAPPPMGGAGPGDIQGYQRQLEQAVQEKGLAAFYGPGTPGAQKLPGIAAHAAQQVDRLCGAWRIQREIATDIVRLALYDVVIFIDDSGSMSFEENGERIKDLQLILQRVAFASTLFDQDGIELRFMNDDSIPPNMISGIRTEQQIEQIMQNKRYKGLTPFGTELRKKVIDPILVQKLRSGMEKPLLIISITDGQPAGESANALMDTVRYAVDEARRSRYGQGAVAFQFAQVGNDQKATEFLAKLDNDPMVGREVDCTSNYENESAEMARAQPPVDLTPDLWMIKLILGAIDPSYDTKDEKANMAPGAGMPPPQHGGYGGPPPGQYGGPPPGQYGGPPPGQYGGPPPGQYGGPPPGQYGGPPPGQYGQGPPGGYNRPPPGPPGQGGYGAPPPGPPRY